MGKNEKKCERDYKRHVRIWKFVRFAFSGLFKKIFAYSYENAPDSLQGPYIVLANHNTNLDPVLVGLSFPQQMYFVASDQVYRHGFVSKILRWTFEPIAKIKGSSDTLTVMKMIRTLRSGKNVCMFPEGNRSFNGVTGAIYEATGKLVKTSGATLVTYKLMGGYFTSPRWGMAGIRKGKMHGKIVNIYDKEKLKQMDAAEITQCIRNDLAEDAYKTQEQWDVPYKCKNIAQGIEYAYCVCPKCRAIGGIKSYKNEIVCDCCGMKTGLNEKGYFSEEFDFHSVYEWDVWQEDFYKDYVNSCDCKDILFSDDDICVKTISSDSKECILGVGRIEMYKNCLVFKKDLIDCGEWGAEGEREPEGGDLPDCDDCAPAGGDLPDCDDCAPAGDKLPGGDLNINIMDIPDMSIFGHCILMFTDVNGIHYELSRNKKGEFFNARKYLSCWKIIR